MEMVSFPKDRDVTGIDLRSRPRAQRHMPCRQC